MFMSGPRRSLEYVYVEHVLQVDNPGFGFVRGRLSAFREWEGWSMKGLGDVRRCFTVLLSGPLTRFGDPYKGLVF